MKAFCYFLLLVLSMTPYGVQAKGMPKRSRIAHQHPLKSPFASWVGKKFIILPDPLKHDYYSWTITKAVGSSSRLYGSNDVIYFSKFAGKVITCVKVKKESVTFSVPDYNIEITYSLVSYTDNQKDADLSTTVEPLAPVTELDIVKQAYLGKTVWAYNQAGRDIYNNLWYYDNTKKRLLSELTKYQGIDLPRGTKLTVVDVRWGNNWFKPVWLVVRDDNNDYYCYEVAADRTNKELLSDNTPLVTADKRLSKTESDVESSGSQTLEPLTSFSGETQQETNSFTIPAGHTGYVVWTASADTTGDGNFAATLKKVDDNSDVQMVVNVIGSHSGNTNCYHQGTFYFDVLATENWTIKVYLH